QRQRVVMALPADQLVAANALPGAIPGFARPADADAFSLPDRVEGKTDVLADRVSILIDDRAGRLRQVTIQELAKWPLADEANPGRVLLGVVRQPGFLGHAAHLRLLEIAEREHHARELRLVEPVEEVALVFCRIIASQQQNMVF